MPNYIDETDAQIYFDDRLHTEAWDDADSTDRTKALTMATKAIDALNFQGEKTDPLQENQFPRSGDTEVPQEIKDATCEIALVLLDEDETEEDRYQRSRIGAERYATVQVTYNNIPEEHVLNGIISIAAWRLLKPFLRDPRSIVIDRA